MRTLLIPLLTTLFSALLSTQILRGQELDARVIVNRGQVQGTSNSLYENLEKSITELLNDRQWTTMQFKRSERISCTFNITVTKYVESENRFECKLMVQSIRPVYNSSYTTTLFATQDANFNFIYQEYDKLDFRADVIDNDLTAMLGYYAYLIIGMDLDAMAPLGGTEVLRMAQTVTNNAQSLTASAKGWKAFEDGKSRYAIINDYLDSGMTPLRQLQYKYHREGLDVMAENVERGRAAITEAIDLLAEARSNKPMSMWPQLLTEYKRDELVGIFAGKGTAKDKEKIYNTLSSINASQNSAWNQLKQ
jgi:hypothetical protein